MHGNKRRRLVGIVKAYRDIAYRDDINDRDAGNTRVAARVPLHAREITGRSVLSRVIEADARAVF